MKPESGQIKVALLSLAVLLASCAHPPRSHDTIRSEMRATATQQSALASRGDAAGIAALYASDAQIRPPNEEMVSGREAIEKYWQSSFSGGLNTVTITNTEAESCGNTAWEVGTYLVAGADGKVLDKGKYTTIHKRVNGQWKMYRDMFNSDLPATPQ